METVIINANIKFDENLEDIANDNIDDDNNDENINKDNNENDNNIINENNNNDESIPNIPLKTEEEIEDEDNTMKKEFYNQIFYIVKNKLNAKETYNYIILKIVDKSENIQKEIQLIADKIIEYFDIIFNTISNQIDNNQQINLNFNFTTFTNNLINNNTSFYNSKNYIYNNNNNNNSNNSLQNNGNSKDNNNNLPINNIMQNETLPINSYLSQKQYKESMENWNKKNKSQNLKNNNNDINNDNFIKDGHVMKDRRGYSYLFITDGQLYKYHNTGPKSNNSLYLLCSDLKCKGRGSYSRYTQKFQIKFPHTVPYQLHSYYDKLNLS